MNTNYFSYSSADFAADDYFQQWVFNPDAETDSFWQDYLQRHPEKTPATSEAKAILLRLGQDDEDPVAADRQQIVWGKIQNELADEGKSQPVHRTRILPIWRMAASVAAVLVLAATWFFWFKPSKSDVYLTSFGEKKVVFLPDSSEVILNAHSTLRLAKTWDDQQTREVWLDGEGYFNVRKKKGYGNARRGDARFIVHTKDLNVEVLGTSFNVKTRKESTQVVLSEGKVKIDPVNQPNQQSIYMAPGESVIVKEKRNITKTTVNPALYSAWKSNELVLNHTSLREIGNFIEETYGMSVVYESDSLASLVLDGTALPTDNRDYFLKAVTLALDINFTVDKRQIIFKSKIK